MVEGDRNDDHDEDDARAEENGDGEEGGAKVPRLSAIDAVP